MILASATIWRARQRCAAEVAAFRAEVAERWDLAALDAQVRASQRWRRLVGAALNKGEHRSWDFQPLRDASKQYMRNNMDLDDLEAMARFPSIGRPPN